MLRDLKHSNMWLHVAGECVTTAKGNLSVEADPTFLSRTYVMMLFENDDWKSLAEVRDYCLDVTAAMAALKKGFASFDTSGDLSLSKVRGKLKTVSALACLD